MQLLGELLAVAGVIALTYAAFLVTPALGWLVLGVALLASAVVLVFAGADGQGWSWRR